MQNQQEENNELMEELAQFKNQNNELKKKLVNQDQLV